MLKELDKVIAMKWEEEGEKGTQMAVKAISNYLS